MASRANSSTIACRARAHSARWHRGGGSPQLANRMDREKWEVSSGRNRTLAPADHGVGDRDRADIVTVDEELARERSYGLTEMWEIRNHNGGLHVSSVVGTSGPRASLGQRDTP